MTGLDISGPSHVLIPVRPDRMTDPRHGGHFVPDTWVTLFAFWREVLMPWKASSVMEERLRFVGRLLDGEAMTDVCRDFGISRKTGYKIFDRYKEHGLAGPQRPLAAAGALCQ